MENANLNGEIVSPRNIDEMDDEAFEAYIKSAEEGEVQADTNSGTAEPASETPYMSFDTKEALQEFQDRTIGNRLREIREMGERDRERITNLCELAKQRYQTSDGDEAVALLTSELTAKNAENAGMSAEQYSFMNEIRSLRSEATYRKRVNEIQEDWKRQETALKNIVPEFDLDKAFSNPEFYSAVVENHMSIAEAYPVLKQSRPSYNISEIGNLTNGVSGYIKRDVASMSDREFDEYIKKIKNS